MNNSNGMVGQIEVTEKNMEKDYLLFSEKRRMEIGKIYPQKHPQKT